MREDDDDGNCTKQRLERVREPGSDHFMSEILRQDSVETSIIVRLYV